MDRSGRSVARVRLSFSAIFSPVIGPFFFTISIICSWRFDNSICLHPLHMYYDILYVDLHSYGIYYITTFLPNQCLSCKQIRKKKKKNPFVHMDSHKGRSTRFRSRKMTHSRYPISFKNARTFSQSSATRPGS